MLFHLPFRPIAAAIAIGACGAIAPVFGRTLKRDSATYGSLTGTEVTMTGRSELHLAGGGDPVPGSTVHLESEEALGEPAEPTRRKPFEPTAS